MTPREQLEQTIRKAIEDVSIRAQGQPGQLPNLIADAVDALRPAPMALTEEWLREAEKTVRESPESLLAECLNHIRWLEGVLADRCKDTHDRDALRQEGREEERREVLELLREIQGDPGTGLWRNIGDAMRAVESRGPTRPDALHDLRAEVRALREALAELLWECEVHDQEYQHMTSEAALEKARALLGEDQEKT